MREAAKKYERLHADGQPGHGRERPAAGRRAGPGRRHRRRSRKSTSGPTGPIWPQAPKIIDAARRRRPGADVRPLGRVARRRRPMLRPYAKRPATTRSTGAAGGTSAPAPSATWPATPPTWPFRRLKLGAPDDASSAEAGDVNPETYPAWAHVTYRVPGPRRHAGRSRSHWYEGKQDGKTRAAAGGAAREGAQEGREARRQRLDPRRREGHPVLARTTTARSSGSRRRRTSPSVQDARSPRSCRPTARRRPAA